jgi:hypothetical protein
MIILAAAVALAVGGTVGAVVAQQPPALVKADLQPDTRTSPPLPWLSGASGEGVTDGTFGAWRGSPVEIAATWMDNNEGQVQLWFLKSGESYGDWTLPLDVSIGAIGDGETWEAAAAGGYDSRWRESLTNLRDLRAGRGTTYIRFAHEMNGDWYPWSVNSGNYRAFVQAWRHFRQLQREIFPEAKLVFGVNRESVGTNMDWREFFPGAEYVDVIGVDYYNQSPHIETAEEWDEAVQATDHWGGPKGLEQHRRFAESVGLPLALPEWGSNASEGDSPHFFREMYEFFSAHAGSGPGQVLYEILFNVDRDERHFVLYDEYIRMPESARVYQELW